MPLDLLSSISSSFSYRALLVSLDGFLDNLFGFLDTFETFDFGRAWLLEIFVMIEMVFDLLECLLG